MNKPVLFAKFGKCIEIALLKLDIGPQKSRCFLPKAATPVSLPAAV
jgi:hypothetical protein